MTKIGYRFINWALIFLAGFIFYELSRDIDGMEGTIVSEQYKGTHWAKDLQTIDLDDSFVYVQIEKNDNFKIGDRVKIKHKESIISLSHPASGILLSIFAIVCIVIAVFRTFIAADDDWSYRQLKD